MKSSFDPQLKSNASKNKNSVDITANQLVILRKQKVNMPTKRQSKLPSDS